MSERNCTVESCERRYLARGLCSMHYQRLRSHGDTSHPGRTNDDRFFERVTKREDTGCWEWTGALLPHGYAYFSVNCRMVYAHRWSYERFVAPIPERLEIDHLCRNRCCVNPVHLEPVTKAENIRRAAAVRTTCPQGHPYDGVYRGYRTCATCQRDRARITSRRKRQRH